MKKRTPKTVEPLVLDGHQIIFRQLDDGRVDVEVVTPETSTHLEFEDRLGWLTKRASGGWDAHNEAGRRWVGCPSQSDAATHLLKAYLQQEEAQRQREANRGPNALFKTTLTMWTRTKPDVGRAEDPRRQFVVSTTNTIPF